MVSKVKVEIFGIKDQPAGGGCSCSCCSGSVQTVGEKYDLLVKFLKEHNLSDKVEIKFIELNRENLKKYAEINKLFKGGYYLPMTLVNGVIKFSGPFSNEDIHEEIKNHLNN